MNPRDVNEQSLPIALNIVTRPPRTPQTII